MLKDHVEKYYFDGNYNCAEAILHAANECYDLGLEEESMKLVSGFGAGIQTGNVCGAVLSAVSIMSLKFVATKAHESGMIKPVVEDLLSRFREALEDSLLCCDIKQRFFKPEVRCLFTVQTACDIIDEILTQAEA